VLDGGMFFSATDECVLDEPQDNPIPRGYLDCDPMGNLPIARLTDVDVEGEIDGFPSFAFIATQQHVFDKWFTLCHKNVFLFCHPKWVYPQNSCDEARFSNGSLLLPYRSAVPPKLEVYPALTQDLLKFGDIITTNMERAIRISGVSRGAPPPGTRAAASLYFYDEQEQTANSVFRRKFEDFVVRIEALKLCLISKYYAGDRKRLIWTLGRDERWLAESVDVSVLKNKYTVRIKSSSNLPDSKYARIQALLDIAGQFPDVVTKEHVLEMLEFGQQDKFLDYARVSVMAAEAENEHLMAGDEIDPPEVFELQMAHWKSHNKLAQDPEYKKQSKEIKQRIEDHIGAHELIMLTLGENNPAYKQQLMGLNQFPLFAPLPPPIPGISQPSVEPPPNPVGRPPGINSEKLAGALSGGVPEPAAPSPSMNG
jgi:hypothetical protein